MILTADQNGLFVRSTYGERITIKQAGFRWSPERKRWEAPSPFVAMRLSDYADDAARSLLGARSVNAPSEIPVPDGCSYRPYQTDYVNYAASRRDILCADEPGLGKTVESIALANLKHTQSLLVVCPAIVKETWRRHLETWLTDPHTVGVVWPGAPFPSVADVVVVNYDLLKRHSAAIHERHWDGLIVDECHAIKGDSIRTSEILGKRTRGSSGWDVPPVIAETRQFLSGTPMLNHPSELWNILHSAGVATNWMDYHRRYAGLHKTRFGWDRSGATNLPELHALLTQTIMIRRLKRDVLGELPPKTIAMIYLSDLDRSLFDMELAEHERGESLRERLRALKVDAFRTPAEYKLAVEDLTDQANASFATLAKLRKATGINKMPKVIEYAKNVLESESKLVIFCYHREVTVGVTEGLQEYGAKMLIGGMGDAERQRVIDDFQQSDGCRVAVCSIKAAGVGITLTAASAAVYAEFDYTPGYIDQAADRLHRMGQKNAVTLHYLVRDGSLDARMLQRMALKQESINIAIEGAGA